MLQQRLGAKAEFAGPSFSPEDLCFAEQLAFVRHRGKRVVARTTRRAGKSTGIGIKMIAAALSPPFANQGYATISLKNSKRLVWPVLKRLNTKFNLGGVPNEQEGFLRFPGLPDEPKIYLGGLGATDEIEKWRGYEGGLKAFVVDEAQSIRQGLLKEAIDEVVEPSLADYDGELTVLGSPGPVPAGYFYDIDVGKYSAGWDHFFWSIRQNPWIERKSGKSVDIYLRELLARRQWTEEHPTYRRQYLGEWVNDPDALVFKWQDGRNGVDVLPDLTEGKWSFILAGDLGFDDADAIGILGWRPHDPNVYLFDEHVQAKAGMTAFVEALKKMEKKYAAYGSVLAIVLDLGGLAKKAIEDFRARFTLPLEAADKARKLDHLELLNDAMLSGRFKALRTSRFAQDCKIVQWDSDAWSRGERKIAREPHTDIGDTVLYGYMRCLAWLARPAPPAPEDVSFTRRLFLEEQRSKSRDPYAAAFGIDD